MRTYSLAFCTLVIIERSVDFFQRPRKSNLRGVGDMLTFSCTILNSQFDSELLCNSNRAKLSHKCKFAIHRIKPFQISNSKIQNMQKILIVKPFFWRERNVLLMETRISTHFENVLNSQLKFDAIKII
jgi:hypothetical protein